MDQPGSGNGKGAPTGGAYPTGTAAGWPGQGAGEARPEGRAGSGLAAQGRVGASQSRDRGPQEEAKATVPGPGTEARRPAAQAPTPVEAPTPAMPKGGGAIRSIAEKFSANPATGSGGMAIPIATSPGRGGFGPELSVSYSSGAGNGLFGVGWSLSVPSISRKTDKGLPRYRDDLASDTFILSGAEDLVPLLVESEGEWDVDVASVGSERRERYRPRVESGFARIERVTDTSSGNIFWRATTKDDVTSTYGETSAARVADPEHPNRVFRWLLERTEDDRGNVVLYEYKAEDLTGVPNSAHERQRHDGTANLAGRHLKRIFYGNKQGETDPDEPADFHFEVVFDYGEHDGTAPTPTESTDWAVRADPFSSYRAGFEIRSYRLCQRVLMFHRGLGTTPDPLLVRSTDFTYEQSGAVSYLTRAEHKGYIWDSGESEYDAEALPPVDFDYSRATFSSSVQLLDGDGARRLPQGVDGRAYQWVDLDGEGIAGVLTQQGGAIYYGRNLGQGKLGARQALRTKPSGARLGNAVQAGGGQQLLDVTGDGLPDLVDYGGPVRGFHARSRDGSWRPFRYFSQLPNIDFSDPSLRFIDLTGDGFADVVMSDSHVYTWWPSKQEGGFDAPRRASRFNDERKGPTAVFAEAEQTVFLADMSGDGLSDLVRVRNGSVCYWPNLGYGRFGAKVTMSDAPHMAESNLFSPSRVRLADIDGTGTADLLYIGAKGVHVYMNEAGNSFGPETKLAVFPGASALNTVDVVDLMGSGTSCLVWSTPLSGKPPSVRYVDLLSSTKPHLLTSVINNLGLETRIAYTTSTKFYLEDKLAGIEWATRLPFPVQVIERVEHYDDVSKLRFISTYRYRHGFYDPEEREFRGFGYVEQRDAESVSEELGRDPDLFPDNNYPVLNGEMQLHPAVSKSWFHTGTWGQKQALLGTYESEWFDGNSSEPRLAHPVIPAGLSALELHEAHRALAGRLLRQEIYAEDGDPDEDKPYAVTQQTYEVTELQPPGAPPHASFFVAPRETLTIQYERTTTNPRIAHELVIAVDAFGYPTKTASVGYGALQADYDEQEKTWVLTTESSFFHKPDTTSWYRHGVPLETKSWEMGSGLSPGGDIFTVDELSAAWSYTEVDYDATLGSTNKRLLTHTKERYWKNDLTDPLAFGSVESLALPYQSYAKALTANMLSSTLGGNVSSSEAEDDGGYQDLDSDGDYWAKSGISTYDDDATGAGGTPFYLLEQVTDVFDNDTTIAYDSYKLFVTTVTDALSLTVTASIDYRVLAPWKVVDINGNWTEAAFDGLGRVTKTAVIGKASEGDSLSDPTAKFSYDLDRYRTSSSPTDLKPARVKTEAREAHGGTASWLVSYSYADGSGNEVQAKVLAEDGDAPELDENGHPVFVDDELQYEAASPRWVGTGRTVYDNKGNPIKQYEPFFSATEEFEDDPDIVEWGVTPLLHYDPLGRLIRTDFPDGSYSYVEFDPWSQTTYDRNDTVATTGNNWYTAMNAGDAGQQDAAAKALAHADTPTTTYFDALGRPFLVKEDNSNGGTVYYETKSVLDIQGNMLELVDAKARSCMTYVYGMLGQVLTQDSIDAGQRWMFTTAAGEPVKRWGERSPVHTHSYVYDELRRPIETWMNVSSTDYMVELYVYGESHSSASANNLKGKLVLLFDQSGRLITDDYDFKGNLESQTRQLALNYTTTIDWSSYLGSLPGSPTPQDYIDATDSAVESETFDHAYAYDALNRPTSVTTPDDSEVLPTYNDAGLLETVSVKVRGDSTATDFVTAIDYDEKGRRTKITYDNGTYTEYTYDPLTYRLEHFKTTRTSDSKLLQSLAYYYDAVGNITSTKDTATQDVYFDASSVPSADGDFTYDAIYRLISADGREHEAGADVQRDEQGLPIHNIPHANDPSGLRRYTRDYSYDEVGNITQMDHDAAPSSTGDWTRNYTYVSGTNRLDTVSHPGGTRSFPRDAHGNITQMAHLDSLDWDHLDQLRHVEVTTGQDVYFIYDASGQRVRKVWEHAGLVHERIYLGGYEIWREHTGSISSPPSPDEERETLHISDDARRVCMVETLTVTSGSPVGSPTPRYRYQYDNHLGTACVEADTSGAVISYEEYHPYGTSSYRSFQSSEVSDKRYRYTGKERDEETSLAYHGARYYAPWLGRWCSADPAGTVDGTNLYAYVRGSPIGLVDPNGMQSLTIEDQGEVVRPHGDVVAEHVPERAPARSAPAKPPVVSDEPPEATPAKGVKIEKTGEGGPAPTKGEAISSGDEDPLLSGEGTLATAKPQAEPPNLDQIVGIGLGFAEHFVRQQLRQLPVFGPLIEAGENLVRDYEFHAGAYEFQRERGKSRLASVFSSALLLIPTARLAYHSERERVARARGDEAEAQAQETAFWGTAIGIAVGVLAMAAGGGGRTVRRPLKPADLGMSESTIVEGTFSVRNGRATARVDYLGQPPEGLGRSLLGARNKLKARARAEGATELRIETSPVIEATGRLRKVLERAGFRVRPNGTMWWEGGI